MGDLKAVAGWQRRRSPCPDGPPGTCQVRRLFPLLPHWAACARDQCPVASHSESPWSIRSCPESDSPDPWRGISEPPVQITGTRNCVRKEKPLFASVASRSSTRRSRRKADAQSTCNSHRAERVDVRPRSQRRARPLLWRQKQRRTRDEPLRGQNRIAIVGLVRPNQSPDLRHVIHSAP